MEYDMECREAYQGLHKEIFHLWMDVASELDKTSELEASKILAQVRRQMVELGLEYHQAELEWLHKRPQPELPRAVKYTLAEGGFALRNCLIVPGALHNYRDKFEDSTRLYYFNSLIGVAAVAVTTVPGEDIFFPGPVIKEWTVWQL